MATATTAPASPASSWALVAAGRRPILHVLGDDRAVGGVEGVEAGVDERRRQPQGHIGAAVPEAHGHEAAGGQRRPAGDEREAAAAAIRPDADRDRHAEAGDRVDRHDRSDQRRGVLDPLEQHRQVGGGQSAARPGAHRGEGERDEEGPAAAKESRSATPAERATDGLDTATLHGVRRELTGSGGRPRAGGLVPRSRSRWWCRAGPRRPPGAAASVTRARVAANADAAAAEMAAAPRRGQQAQQPAAAARLEQDRLEPSVGGIGAGVDLEAEAEEREVREEELCRVARGEAPESSSTRARYGAYRRTALTSARRPWRRSAELSAS